jgi:dihydroflavonol-4-reductase|eukprot:COSAG01_NODE_607_length_14866_cov_60.568633_8_plen_303_part_00
MSQKKYLLTGASGFLGHHLVHQLVVDGASVSIFDLHPPGSSPTDPTAFRPAEHFQLDAEQAERVSYIKGSILEEEKLEAACEGVDGVFHLAGIVKHSRDNPHPPTVDFAWKVNVDGTYAVFRAVAKAGSRQGRTARIVYASSSGCVACQKKKPGPTTVGPGGDSSPFCEHVGVWSPQRPPPSSPSAPALTHLLGLAARGVPLVRGKKHGKYGKFPYYAAKIEVEKVGMPLALELGLEVVWMRPTMMLGPGDHLFRSTGLIVSFLKGSIPMVPCGGASFLDVRDSAAAFKTAMELPKLPRPNP